MEMSSVRVLLLEDSRVQTRLIQELLSRQDGGAFCLECADCLTTGLHRLAIGGIDVVLLDLLLPESQGLETFLRVYRAAPNVPIVVLTGLDDRMLAITAVQEGAEDYLVKGQVDGENLARALRYAVERHRRRRAEEMWDGADQQFRGARAVQQKLLPKVPELSSFDIGGMSYCAVGTCGDYFDYIPMSGNRIGIIENPNSKLAEVR